MLKKFIACIIISVAAMMPMRAADGDLFPYPVIPDEIVSLSERCDYLVEHFWEKCNIKSAMSMRDKLESCFADWSSFMPYGTENVVMPAIDRLMKSVAKSPEQTLFFARLAEKYMYSDSADYISDQLYLPFAQAAVANRKISSADRAVFEAQVRRIESSAIGAKVPSITVYDPQSQKLDLATMLGGNNIILFFHDPDCLDCRIARTRLAADYNLKQLTADGSVRVLCIYPGDPTDEAWAAEATSLPEGWTSVAAPDVDLYFDLRETPQFYLIDEGVVVNKNVPIESLLKAFAVMNE